MITNKALDSQGIYYIKLGGQFPGMYEETNNCPSSLAHYASCTVSVTFTPRIRRSLDADLEIGGGGPPHVLQIYGTGIGK